MKPGFIGAGRTGVPMTVVDAPVPGGQLGAEAATLPIVCGGKHKAARGAQA